MLTGLIYSFWGNNLANQRSDYQEGLRKSPIGWWINLLIYINVKACDLHSILTFIACHLQMDGRKHRMKAEWPRTLERNKSPTATLCTWLELSQIARIVRLAPPVRVCIVGESSLERPTNRPFTKNERKSVYCISRSIALACSSGCSYGLLVACARPRHAA